MKTRDSIQEALILHQTGKLDEAKKIYKNILKKNKNNSDASHLLGVLEYQKKNYDLAIELIKHAISLNDKVAAYHNNLANVYKDTEKTMDAIKFYNNALNLDPDYFGSLHNLGILNSKIQNFEEALSLYSRAIKINPNHIETYINYGHVLHLMKRYQESLDVFSKCLISHQNEKVYSARGLLLMSMHLNNQALKDFNKSISINKDHFDSYVNRAVCFYNLKKYKEAIIDFEKALSMRNDEQHLIVKIMISKLKICDWNNFEELKKKILNISKKNLISGGAMENLGLFDDPKLYYDVLNKNNIKNYSNLHQHLTTKIIYKEKKKINIGYFSPDFSDHPIAYLFHEVLLNHDRKNFNIFAFDLKGKSNVKLHQDIKKNLENNFYYVDQISDLEIAQLSRNLNLDIAVDLAGYTVGSRTGIFNIRCAPIQINYLGFPGTMGANFFDYILCDENLVTPDQFKFYNEKIVYLPNCYQSNETYNKNLISNYTREDFNISHNQFVYCCFNSTWKINPDIFDIWMEILRSVKNSSLWLLAEDSCVKKNLIKEAKKRGISKDRLVFSEFLPRLEHLKRQKLADLFLDTYPYGAHTTCSDCLRSGVPLLALSGKSFQSRVSSSILKSCNLDEWITTNLEDYKQKAIEIGNNKDSHDRIKLDIINKASNSNLFNNKLFTNNLENVYKKMIDRLKLQLPPDHIKI